MQADILGFSFQEITPLLNEIIALKVVDPEMIRDYEPVVIKGGVSELGVFPSLSTPEFPPPPRNFSKLDQMVLQYSYCGVFIVPFYAFSIVMRN